MQQGNFGSYIAVTKKRLPVIGLISLVAAIVAYGVVARIKPQYEVHYSYIVSLSQREAPGEFRFDGLYAIQATDLFAATLASLAKAPEVVVQAYEEAGIPVPSEDVRALSKTIRADKTGPQLVQITVRDESKVRAQSLAEGLQTVLQKQITAYHDQGIPQVHFRAVANEAWTGVTAVSAPVVVSATFVFAFLFLLNAVLLVESVKRLS